MRAMEAWRRADGVLPALDVNWCGSLLYDLPEPELRDFQHNHAAMGYDVRLVDQAMAKLREPRLKRLPDVSLICDQEAAVEPTAAAHVFLKAALDAGAVMVNAKVLSLGAQATVSTDQGIITADEVVIAAGLGSVALLQARGIPLPVDAVPGLLASTQPVPPILNGLVLSKHFHVRQRRDGSLLIGSDFSGNLRGTPEQDAAQLVRAVNDALDAPEELQMQNWSLGVRPSPRDGLPLIGRHEALPQAYIAVMHSGVTLAPLVGEAVVAEVLHDREFEGMEMFRLATRCGPLAK
jgi:glycine/D-amino acid oxidase-like deaminating enzyme